MSELDQYDEDLDKSQGVPLRRRVAALRRVLPFAAPFRREFMIGGALMLLATVASVMQPLVFRHIFDVNLPAKDVNGVLLSGLVFLGLLVSATALRYFQTVILGIAGVSVVNRLKRVVFDKILTFELAYYDKNPVGRLVSRVESDCERLVGLFTAVGLQVISSSLVVLGSLIVLYTVEWRLAVAMNIAVFVILGGALAFFQWMRPRFREERNKIAAVTAVATEFTQGARLIRLLGREEYARQRMRDVNDDKIKFMIGTFIRFTWFFFPLGMMQTATLGAVLWYGADWQRVGAFTIGAVVMFAQYIMQVFGPLFELSEQLGEIQRSLGSADRILELLDRDPVVVEAAAPKALPALNHAIRLERVTFSYNPDKVILKNVSLDIPAGKRIALVGPTGGGKSTVINMLLRFYDPQQGRVTWDGVDIREVAQAELRSRIGLVLQDLYLFPGTLEENLRALRNDVPRWQIERAIEQLGTGDIIRRLPNGLMTEFAERSANISFGERQLIAFTRALVFNPELLILDEATSSVDPETERKIEESLARLVTGRTAVIVAHRLSTIRTCDAIAVVKGGEIIELGRHEELLAQQGFYSKLYRIQFPEAARGAA